MSALVRRLVSSIPRSGTGSFYDIKEYEERKKMESKFDITLSVEQINIILASLGKLSFDTSAAIIQLIHMQIKDQQDLQSNAIAEGDFEEVEEEGEDNANI